ncbi:MAG: hypothetical protein KA059_02560 [Elusimicrobiales bacterium]|jgi:hypothetical protein|nr:hypothetical protein [Elusimicrobiales bacterium]NLH39634.1 hypothetical protein [Elusimicrobiota bacterium]
MRFNFLLLGMMFCCLTTLNSKSLSDFSYTSGSDGFNRYSLTYQTVLSTSNLCGINYSLYNSKHYPSINSVRLIYNHYLKKNFFITVKPFYYFDKDDTSSFGAKTGVGFIKAGDEIYSTYSLFISYQSQKILSSRYNDFFIESSFEKDYYNQFFIFLKAALNISYDGHSYGYADNSDLVNYNYLGPLTSTLYSDFGVRFGRSFKPDFNSYFYTGFDRLNAKGSDINSYSAGFEAILDENENYSMDISYNYADFKSKNNDSFWKFKLGVNF